MAETAVTAASVRHPSNETACFANNRTYREMATEGRSLDVGEDVNERPTKRARVEDVPEAAGQFDQLVCKKATNSRR